MSKPASNPAKQPRDRYPGFALAYASSLPLLQHVAREHGYALAVHGSMRTDLDLIAAPWIPGAAPAEELVAAFCEALDGEIREQPEGWEQCPAYRAHGRRAWAIYVSDHCYLDVSILPREEDWGTPGLASPFLRGETP